MQHSAFTETHQLLDHFEYAGTPSDFLDSTVVRPPPSPAFIKVHGMQLRSWSNSRSHRVKPCRCPVLQGAAHQGSGVLCT
jgi:hypothetical protein